MNRTMLELKYLNQILFQDWLIAYESNHVGIEMMLSQTAGHFANMYESNHVGIEISVLHF